MADRIPTGLKTPSASAAVAAPFTTSEGRRFGFPVGAAFLALGALLLWRGHPQVAAAAALIGACLLVATLLLPSRLGPVYRGWMGLAGAISTVTTPLFMGVVYFGVFTPVGWLRRTLAGRSSTRHTETVWVPREATARRSDLQRQF